MCVTHRYNTTRLYLHHTFLLHTECCSVLQRVAGCCSPICMWRNCMSCDQKIPRSEFWECSIVLRSGCILLTHCNTLQHNATHCNTMTIVQHNDIALRHNDSSATLWHRTATQWPKWNQMTSHYNATTIVQHNNITLQYNDCIATHSLFVLTTTSHCNTMTIVQHNEITLQHNDHTAT